MDSIGGATVGAGTVGAGTAGAVGVDSVGESRWLEEGGRPDSGSVVLSIADAVSFGSGEVAWGNSLALSGFPGCASGVSVRMRVVAAKR